MSLTPETDSTQKISEEMSRLITLANTVLTTKIPNLACTNSDIDSISFQTNDKTRHHTNSLSFLNQIKEDTTNMLPLNAASDENNTFVSIENKLIEAKDSIQDLILPPSPLPCGLENDFANIKIKKENSTKTETSVKTHRLVEKRNEYNAANFIEDESGFSSMSSFQEIGIPIISIIPPSPSKEVGYIDEITDILDDSNNWKNDSLELEKQAVKVFWV